MQHAENNYGYIMYNLCMEANQDTLQVNDGL